MTTALTLLVIQGVLGAFDTLWYHEFQQRLPGRPEARHELRLHAVRDFFYALIFASLAWVTWGGVLAWVLLTVLACEVVVTLWDFLEEDRTRKLPAGERVMHAVMGIIYGAFVAYLLPHLFAWSRQETGFGRVQYGWLSWVMTAMAVGVFLSGVRDLLASFGFPAATGKQVVRTAAE